MVGGLGTVAHLSTLYFLVEGTGSEPLLASFIGFLASLFLSYWLNATWTFGAVRQQHRRALLRYFAVSVMGLCLNTLIMFLLIKILGLWYFASQIVAAVLVPFHNLLLNTYWTFER